MERCNEQFRMNFEPKIWPVVRTFLIIKRTDKQTSLKKRCFRWKQNKRCYKWMVPCTMRTADRINETISSSVRAKMTIGIFHNVFFFFKALLGNDLICNQHENKLKIWCDKTCVSLAFKNYLNYCICYFVRLL